MNPSNSQVSMDEIANVLKSASKKGVRFWAENGQLHYRAPKGALTQDEIEIIRLSREPIIAFLKGTPGAETGEPGLAHRPRLDRAPLAFSQLSHWHLYQLSERCAIREIASATRLRGRLNVDALQESIAEIVRRHDALRTRIVVYDGVPVQEIAPRCDCELKVRDLSELSEVSHELEVNRLIEQLILEPIDVSVGPLLGIELLRLRNDEHMLIVAMQHMISDAFSMNILLRDLFTAYIQVSKGQVFSLPTIPIQFGDYAAWRRSAERPLLKEHGEYWNRRLAGCKRLRFPQDQSMEAATRSGWGVVPIEIGMNLKAELSDWCRLERTTLVMAVFTAYVGLVLRWCNASESVIRYQSDGRVSPKLENTIGFFASMLYLRIALFENDSFLNLIDRVTEEYCKAHEHADFSYIAAQVPRPDFTRNTVFNWVPQDFKANLFELGGSEHTIACSPVRFVHPMLKDLEMDSEPTILLSDYEDEIVGGVYFPLNRFSMHIMERFGRNFLMFIWSLLRQPEVRVKDIVLL